MIILFEMSRKVMVMNEVNCENLNILLWASEYLSGLRSSEYSSVKAKFLDFPQRPQINDVELLTCN